MSKDQALGSGGEGMNWQTRAGQLACVRGTKGRQQFRLHEILSGVPQTTLQELPQHVEQLVDPGLWSVFYELQLFHGRSR